jgi:3-oxoacyl-[acyl-carrier-protein] synthase II
MPPMLFMILLNSLSGGGIVSRRVVITGLGMVTPIGTGVDDFYQGLVSGRNGVSRLTRFDPSEYASRMAAEVGDFDPAAFMDAKKRKSMDRFAQFGFAAARLALDDSGLDLERIDRDRAGVFIGSGNGGNKSIQEEYAVLREKGPGRVSPRFITKVLINMAASQVSIEWGLRGPILSLSNACSTANQSIGSAFRSIQYNEADAMLAGGTEAAVTELPYAGFCALRAMSRRNEDVEHASRPFDRERDGFVMGEGSGVVLLEELEHALSRGARIYAEVIGYGSTSDAYHLVAPPPDGGGAARAMKLALADARLDIEKVTYVSAHGTSTPLNDKTETLALKTVYGDHAYKLAVSAPKSMFGHLLGGASGVELGAACLALERGVIPPTINYEFPDPECDLDYVPIEARETQADYAMCNSFGFGGLNAVILLRRFGS